MARIIVGDSVKVDGRFHAEAIQYSGKRRMKTRSRLVSSRFPASVRKEWSRGEGKLTSFNVKKTAYFGYLANFHYK